MPPFPPRSQWHGISDSSINVRMVYDYFTDVIRFPVLGSMRTQLSSVSSGIKPEFPQKPERARFSEPIAGYTCVPKRYVNSQIHEKNFAKAAALC